jgi:ArsR family transcriptional regulator
MRPNLSGQPIPQKLENERDKELLMNFLDAIANRERFQLLDMIRKQPLCVSDIAEKMGKSHSTISHHLKFLESMNVIKGWKSGKFTYFSLIQTQIQKFLEIFEIWLGTSTNWLKTT